MSSKNFNSFKDFQSDQIQTTSRKLFTAHFACSNSDLNLTLVTGTTNGFIFQIINSLIESWGLRLTCFDCNNYVNSICRYFTVFTTLFTNMRILKFKSQLTIEFFPAVNHLDGPLRKRDFTLTGSKGHALWFVIGGFRSVMCVSVFQGSLLGIVIMIDGSEKRNCESGFWTLEFACFRKAQ